MTLQKRIAKIGHAKQTAKGTLIASTVGPSYQVGVTTGQLAKAELGEEELNLTWSDRFIQGHDRITVTPGFEYETVVTPKMIGEMLMGVMGTDTITGAGPYTHTFSVANALPYFTTYVLQDGNWFQLGDSMMSDLELSWDRAGALKAKMMGIACTHTVLASAYTVPGTADELVAAGTFDGQGGIASINGSNVIIKQGSLKISNKVEAVFGTDTTLPKEVFPGTHTMDVSLTVIPADYSLFKQAVTGSTSGTTPVGTSTYTTAQLKWIFDTNTDLTVNINRMRMLVAWPTQDAAGGPVELVIEGSVAEATSGAPYSIVLRNGVTTAY